MWNVFISTILSFPGTNRGALLTAQDVCLRFIPPGAPAHQPLPLTTSRPFVMYKGNENIYLGMSLGVTLLTAGRRAFVRSPVTFSFVLYPCGWLPQGHACCSAVFPSRDLSQGSFSWGLLSLDGTGSRIIPLAFPGNSKSSVVIAGSLF